VIACYFMPWAYGIYEQVIGLGKEAGKQSLPECSQNEATKNRHMDPRDVTYRTSSSHLRTYPTNPMKHVNQEG